MAIRSLDTLQQVALPTAGTDITNKTYVDGLISGLSGTYVGLTGNQTIAGVKTFSSYIDVRRASQYDAMILGRQTGDAQSRISVLANGEFQFGDGTNNADTFLYRWYTANMGVKGTLNVRELAATDEAYTARATGDSFPRFATRVDGRLVWGSGVAGFDVKLERTGANELTLEAGDVIKTDTRPAGTNDKTLANTEFVQAATGSMSAVRPSVKLMRGSAMAAGDISWDIEIHKTDTSFRNVSFPTRVYFPSSGMYSVNTTMMLAATSVIYLATPSITWYSSAGVSKGTVALGQYYQPAKGGADFDSYDLATTVNAVAGDYIVVTQANGSSLNTHGHPTAPYTQITVDWLGATGTAWGNASAVMTNSASVNTTPSWAKVAMDAAPKLEGWTFDDANDRLVCGTAGQYSMTAAMSWPTTATAQTMGMGFRINGAAKLGSVREWQKAAVSGVTTESLAYIDDFVVGDYIEFWAYTTTSRFINVGSPIIKLARMGYGSGGGGGGVSYTVSTVKTANYTATTSGEVVRCNSSAGSFIVSLPATHTAGTPIIVKDTGNAASSFPVTVNSADGDLIDGSSTYVINMNKESVTFISDGTNWMAT